jgi:hypothetical protein
VAELDRRLRLADEALNERRIRRELRANLLYDQALFETFRAT